VETESYLIPLGRTTEFLLQEHFVPLQKRLHVSQWKSIHEYAFVAYLVYEVNIHMHL
jgi:hypothetical protein